jgi:phenylalanyl-tRNA synthetase alpha chain
VSVEDNYDRLGYPQAAITREARYSRYLGDTVMLRSHTTAGVPPALRALATEPDPPTDLLLVLPGLVYRRDAIDRLHVGEPHQVDIWRIAQDDVDLGAMLDVLVEGLLPGARWRTVPARHPYTEQGRQVDVRIGDEWVELAECGLAAPHVLATAGLDPRRWRGLALGMGLDRAVMLRKGVPDIRLLRATDPRIAEQMLDLSPWRPVSMLPAVRRDLSIVAPAGVDAELLGDRARGALGPDAELLESLTLLARTPHEQLPGPARDRLGTVRTTCCCGWSCARWTGHSPTPRPTRCATASTPPCTRAPATSGPVCRNGNVRRRDGRAGAPCPHGRIRRVLAGERGAGVRAGTRRRATRPRPELIVPNRAPSGSRSR